MKVRTDINLQKRVFPEFDYQIKSLGCPDGSRRLVVLAFRADGTMWMNPADIGVGPQHAALLARFNAPYLLVSEADKIVLIDARAVAEVITKPEDRSNWLNFVETSVQKQKEYRAQYESARNH